MNNSGRCNTVANPSSKRQPPDSTRRIDESIAPLTTHCPANPLWRLIELQVKHRQNQLLQSRSAVGPEASGHVSFELAASTLPITLTRQTGHYAI